MNPSSLDWSIQSTLSSLFPPFEATAPTVLSQLFRTIEERYHGDALQCLLDYLIPAKHILESVQQAACAEYSDVLFLCEGWPLCLRDRVVIQLAPINPLLLRPGDFYLQVEPFGEQSARIVLKSLLVQEDLLAQENLVGFRAQEGPTVEEAPIPETSYPCIFTETWLKEVNEGRHGYRLQRCVLTSDQGIVKVPWTEVVNPEFLDRPKVKIHSAAMTSCSVIMQDNQPPEEEPESQFTANQAPLEIETMILPAKDGVAVSVRLVESGSRLVKVDQGKPVSHSVGKPVGRVSPNTWDSRHNRELEGEYVDLLDFAKDKEVLGLNKAIIPTVPVNFRPAPSPPKRNSVPCGQSSKGAMDKLCIPCSRSKQFPGDFQKGSESKCRHRQSYLAALRNPVSFEKASLMEPLDEAWPGIGEVEPSCEEQGANHGVESLNCSAGRSSTRPVQSCKNFTHQDQNLVQSNMTTKHFDQNVTQPLLLAQFPDILPKSILECKAFSDSRHLYLSEVPRQEPCQMRSSGQKHAKTQHLPKMGLRAFPDHSSHRQEASASKCQGIGRQQMNSFQYGPTSLQYDFTQPTGQRPSLFHHPQNNPKLLQDQNSPMGQWPLYDNKQCGESSVHVLKTSGKSKSKGRSVSSVSDTARECVQVEKLTSRSLSDVYPEIIPMVPAIHAMQSNKCTAFGLASPILDRKKAAKNDTSSPGTGELKSPPLANGLKLQSSLAELPSAAQSQSLSPGYANHLTPLSLVPSIKSLLQLGIIYLPGSRDRVGRAVLEVHGGHTGWARPTLCPLELCRLLLYLHSVPRRAVRDLGLTIVIDSRKSPPPSVLYKALLMVQEQTLHAVHSILLLVDKDQSPRPERKPGLQVDIVTSLKALHKTIEGHQLTSELGGTFPYNHTDWLQFQQKLSLFELDLQGAALLLERAIKNLDSSKKTDMTQDVKSRIQEQKSLMREVLEDARMVTLQREGGAMLARMRKEEFRFAQSEDYRDSMEAVTCLYNQVEEGVHTLVIRSNQSLQRLDHVLILRETEEELNATRMWCKEEEQQWLKDHKLLEETRERLEQRLADLHTVLTQAKEKKEKQLMLIKDVEKKIQGTNYPETDIFHHNTMKFKTNMAAFQLQAEQYKSDLESFISLYHFCEKALSLTKECIHYLEHMEMGSGKAQVSKLKIFEEKLRAFSPWHFEEERTKVRTMHHPGELRVWEEALAQCQFVRQRLEEILLESDENQTSQKPPLKDAGVLRNSEAPLQASSPCKTSASWEDMATGPWEAGAASQAQSTDNNTGSDSETVSCFHLRYMPGGKSRKGGCAPMVVDGLNIAKNCKKEFRADLSSQTQTEETQTHTPFITSSSEKRPSCTLQNKLTESNDSPTRLIAIIDNDAALKNALKTRKFSCKHHSDSDLRTIDLTTGGDKLPWKGTLRHSHSEGSCVSSNLQSTCCPVSVRQKRSTDKPSMLQDDQESIESHQDSLCSSNSSNVQLEWIQMGNRSRPRVSLDDHSPQVSHQEGFCSGVSNPMGGWEEEGGSSAVHPDDTASDSFRLGPVIPDRMQESSSCSRFTALENDSNALKLQHIMEELLHTEREYVKALCYVMEHYFPELERPDVPQDLRGQRGNIFGNLEKLRDFHQHHFLKELEFCLREPFLVGRCFLRHKESFGLYALYSKNKPCSDNLLIHYGKEFFKQKQQQLGDKMDLSSYLLRPVQRISKYSLLLQDMLGEWDLGSHEGHERAEIQAALEVIQFQLRHGNNLLAMDDIQECDVNLKEQGQLICQDEFLVSFRKKKCYRHIFLFQDLILFSKTKKSEVGNDIYIYKQSFKTSDIGMTHNCGDSGLCFEIWFRRRKLQDTYTLQAASREMKGSWTKDLERILWEQAIHNREVRMQERVFMGIGYKPFMDIKPSEAAICDRAINCALTGQECKPAVSSGMSDSQVRFPAQRPNSTGSTSWTSSGSHSPSSSSSSGRCSMSPVSDLIGLSRRGVSAPGHGRPNSGVLEEYDIEQEKGIQILLVDSSESSGESVSGFSSSSYMCEEHSEISIIGVRKACVQKMENNHQKNKDQPKSFPKLQNQKRDQPLKKIQADNHMRTSTEV